MKLWKVGSVVGFTAMALGLSVYTAGCSSDATPDTPLQTGTQPPPPPSGPVTTDTSMKTFAVSKLYLGESTRAGAASDTAWKSFGYNLDTKITAGTSTDVCTRAKGAPSSNQADGTGGIDNAFGAVILPLIKSAASLTDPSKTITDTVQKGSFTIQLSLKGLSDDAKQTATGLKGDLFASGAYQGDSPTPVTFPGFGAGAASIDWPVRAELLNDGATIASGSKVNFQSAYVVNGTFVNGSGGATITLSLAFGGVSLDLSVKRAILTFDHTAPGALSNGTIAGIIDTEELITGLKKVAGRISTTLCGSQFDGIAQQIRQASDILTDGTNAAGKDCNGISIGLGFDAELVKNPTQVAKLTGTTSPDPCTTPPGDAGTDTGTSTDSGGGGG
ncbi:hypothetical protein BH09MYX1_BH09MYX1_35060 [soil metagenome]